MNTKKAAVPFIFITILLDALGIGILIPIFPDLIRRFSSDPAFISQYYGYFISVYAFVQFVASPLLGALSDRFGRRPVLLVSLFGAGMDYILMAYAPELWILFVGRIISGLTGATMTVASAYMADVSDDTNRSANFGMIGGAFGVGFVLGPVIGGALGSLNHAAPFLAAAAMNLLNFAFGYFVLPESLPLEKRRKIEVTRLNPLNSVLKILRPSPILVLVWVYLLLFLAGQAHPSIWTLYTQSKFGWSALQVGVSISIVGLAIGLVQGGLTRVITPKIGEWNSLSFGVIVSVASYFAYAFATESWMMYAILAPGALAGIAGPALQSMISKQVPSNEQGELQGTLVSLSSLSAIVGPLIFTGLFTYFSKPEAPVHFQGAPYFAAALICGLCGLLMVGRKPQ